MHHVMVIAHLENKLLSILLAPMHYIESGEEGVLTGADQPPSPPVHLIRPKRVPLPSHWSIEDNFITMPFASVNK